MNEQYQAPEQNKPAVAKWLWITLITVVIIGGGFAAWYFLMGPGKAVESSTATTTTTPVDETADWKTFTSTTYNYSVKYSKDWFVKEDKTYTAFDKTEIVSSAEGYNPPISISVTTDTPTKIKAGYTIKSETPITLGGVSATKVSSVNQLSKEAFTIVIAQKDTNTFLLFAKSGYEDTLNTMLSTFKFTTAAASATTSTADWKTYTNATYGYTIKYPTNFTVLDYRKNADGTTTQTPESLNINNGKCVGISIGVVKTSQTLDQAIATETTKLEKYKTVTKSAVKVGNVDATKLVSAPLPNTDTDCGNIKVLVVKNSYLYTIAGDTTDTYFDNLLSTFQFTK